jgi:hypothetical protein
VGTGDVNEAVRKVPQGRFAGALDQDDAVRRRPERDEVSEQGEAGIAAGEEDGVVEALFGDEERCAGGRGVGIGGSEGIGDEAGAGETVRHDTLADAADEEPIALVEGVRWNAGNLFRLVGEAEDVLDAAAEDGGEAEGQFRGRGVLAGLDGIDCLAADADAGGQRGLGEASGRADGTKVATDYLLHTT